MDRTEVMLDKIDSAVTACEDSIKEVTVDIDLARYNKLLERLLKLQEGVRNEKIYTDVSDLSIVKMIYQHDPKKLWEAVLDVNLVFREQYSTKL